MVFINLLLYLVSFFVLWLGSGLIISSVDKLSKKLKLSSFAFSFFVLGLFTSIPEFAVGLTAVTENKAEVFVGNLIGGIPVIFLLVIPLLAILGNGIKLKSTLSSRTLLFSFIVMLTPALLVMDRKVTNLEGIIMIILYSVLFFMIQKTKGILDTDHNHILDINSYSYRDIIKIFFGIVFVFVSSHFIVDKTLYFADILHISTFYISLFFLSLGTNLPELSLAIRSVMLKKEDVAFGDYMGSAAANTLLFGIFTLLTTGDVVTVNNFLSPFLTMLIGLGLFFYFSLSKYGITRKEGIILLLVYGVFVISEQIKLI